MVRTLIKKALPLYLARDLRGIVLLECGCIPDASEKEQRDFQEPGGVPIP
jgi:hypothetical protein